LARILGSHSARDARVGILENNRFFVARIHAGDTCPEQVHKGPWEPRAINAVRVLMGGDWEQYFGDEGGLPLNVKAASNRRAFV
jgi:hypothetical protein